MTASRLARLVPEQLIRWRRLLLDLVGVTVRLAGQ